jgi:ubiquitin-protein ligase
MHQSPRTRRLRNDLAALERLRSESSIFRFSAAGDPPQAYQIWFHGKGLSRERARVNILDQHRVEIRLGASYPRSMPEIKWLTPIYHPNISEIGLICLGGFGTHWVPSIQLDELCGMLWDMVRFHNYDIRSPYNRECALWAAGQTTFKFPVDARPLRDLRASQGRTGGPADQPGPSSNAIPSGTSRSQRTSTGRLPTRNSVGRVLHIIERYSRAFGEAPVAAPGARRDNLTAASSQPSVEPVNQTVEPVANVAEDAMGRAEVGASRPHADLETDRGAATRVSTGQADGGHEEPDEVMIVESSPDDARFEGPHRLGVDDEVIFID